MSRFQMDSTLGDPGYGRRSPTESRHLATCMSEESNDEQSSPPRTQFSLRTLFKITTYSAVLIYIVWNSWDHLGLTLIGFILMSPFSFFAEIVDLILGVKKR